MWLAYLSQRLSASSGLSSKVSSHVSTLASKTPPVSVFVPLGRKSIQYHGLYGSRFFSSTAASSTDSALKRYRSATSYLYARRILELAAASAAALATRQGLRTGLESSKLLNQPGAWENFEKRDWTDDLQETLGDTRLQRLWMSTRRLVALSALASPLAVLYPLSLVSQTAHNVSWDYALWAIEKSGPTLIKLVQWATTRQDLFSPEFCSHFGKLRDETRGHAWKETHKMLQEALGEQYDTNVVQVHNKTPIGSGCIAQVYHAQLLQDTTIHPKGTELAIKVQHPGIWKKVCVDFYILGKIAKFLESLPKLNLDYLSIQDSVHQFLNVMLPQLDLRLEASHLKRFNRDFGSDDSVCFPHPLDDLTTPHVLVETFMHGTPIMEYTKAPRAQRQEVARLGLETVLKMIFLNDFVHGDLHPGNVLIIEKHGKLSLGLLDCGLVIEMGPEQHINLVKILGALTRRDGKLAGELMVDTASKCQASPLDVELFVAGMENICRMDEDNNFLEKVGDYIADICFMACKHKVKLEASFINAALAVEIMEGIASALYPDMSVQRMALPMVVKAEMMHRMPTFSVSGWG